VTAGSPFRCVVDASAAIKIVLAEPLSAQANRLFARIAETPPAQFHVPDLFFVECANILWKYIRRRAYPQQRARFDLRYLVGLGLDTTPTADLVEQALQLALTYNLSAYDACYVALAQRLQVPLVTADEAMVRKLAGAPVDVRWLGALPAS
jgi:predicted nucleic acid-binding protein